MSIESTVDKIVAEGIEIHSTGFRQCLYDAGRAHAMADVQQVINEIKVPPHLAAGALEVIRHLCKELDLTY